MRILLVDDEPLALRRLMTVLSGIEGIEIVGTARDGDAAVEEAKRLMPDLVVLDVEMPGRDGIAVASEIERLDGPETVILSAFDRYATAAFEVEAVDYLLKPLRVERLHQAIDRTRRRRAEKSARRAQEEVEAADEPSIHVPDRHGGRDVRLSAVIWIEAARDYALIHTGTRSHILRITMTELARQLPDTILRVHRSAFVALAHVRRWGLPSKGIHSLTLSDGSNVPVGPSYLQETRTALRSLDR